MISIETSLIDLKPALLDVVAIRFTLEMIVSVIERSQANQCMCQCFIICIAWFLQIFRAYTYKFRVVSMCFRKRKLETKKQTINIRVNARNRT